MGFKKFGQWDVVGLICSNMKKEAELAARRSVRNFGLKVEALAKKHMSAQDLGWAPLGKDYKRGKMAAGFSGNILVRTSTYQQSITTWTENNGMKSLAGVKRNVVDEEGEELAKLHERIIVKVPMIKDGVKAIKYFTDKGIKTNCTLVFSAGQALLAAKAGATYVSPFIGRLDDISTDGLNLISEIRMIYDNYGFQTEILAASVRHTMHIIDCAKIGADVMTGPLSVITGLLSHPLTDIGLEKFLADHKKGN